MRMHKGSCLCGAVAYEVDGELGPINYCHCKRCRKATGSAFNTGSPVKASEFRLVKGEGVLGHFVNPATGLDRTFCTKCGSPIYSRRASAPDIIRIRVGTLDTPVTEKPAAHIYVGSKATWFDIHDDLPQHADRP
jgi:hypothetical protein